MASAATTGAADTSSEVVVIEFAELCAAETSEALRAKIARAYGYEGLGLAVVRGVPGVAEARARCLPFARAFGDLPEAIKEKYVLPDAFYSFGWSHGKEKLEGKPDLGKGSYYFNPVHDVPVDDKEEIAKYPTFAHPNIWPEEGDCPGFADACKACGRLIVSTGQQLGAHCDTYVRSVDPTYGTEFALGHVINTARCHKARLLYYFPSETPPAAPAAVEATDVAVKPGDEFSSWCGWHNDHGSLTGLTSAMFFDTAGEAVACPDPDAGLYIRTRTGRTVKATIPPDCLAYQIGECAQVHTGGVLQATPHCVRAAAVPGVARGTLAVFMEPMPNAPMRAPAGTVQERVLRGMRGELLPRGVPPLVARWKGDAQTFGEFSDVTYSMYY